MGKEPGPSTRSDEAGKEAEEQRGYLLGDIKDEIIEGRHGRTLSPSEDQELMKDLSALKEKFGKWKALEGSPVSLAGMRDQLDGLSSAIGETLRLLKKVDPFTSSVLLDSIDGDNPMLESSELKENRLVDGAESQPHCHLQLHWAAMREIDDPLHTSPEAEGRHSALIQNLSSFHRGIEHALRNLDYLAIGSRMDVFSSIFGGSRGQLAHDSWRLYWKFADHEPSRAAHSRLLRALYPWVADLVDHEPFDGVADEAVTEYRAFRKEVAAEERALGWMVAKQLKSDDGVFGPTSQEQFLESAKPLAALYSRRFRSAKKRKLSIQEGTPRKG